MAIRNHRGILTYGYTFSVERLRRLSNTKAAILVCPVFALSNIAGRSKYTLNIVKRVVNTALEFYKSYLRGEYDPDTLNILSQT